MGQLIKLRTGKSLQPTPPRIAADCKPATIRPIRPKRRGGRLKNIEYRPREYLTLDEIRKLMKAAGRRMEGRARWLSVRDRALIWTTFRHALRNIEVINLRWADVDFEHGQLQVRRAKNGIAGVHPIEGEEMRLLRAWKRVQQPSPWVFSTTRGGPMTKQGFHFMMRRLGVAAGLSLSTHPHMLRHSAGYALTERDVPLIVTKNFMGHRSIESTAHYTALSPGRFKGLFGD